MLREMDQNISMHYFALSGFFSWLLLAGFLISPATFSSANYFEALDRSGSVGKYMATAVRNVPVLYIATFACLISMIGLLWLWWKWRHNYLWVNRCLVMYAASLTVTGILLTNLRSPTLLHSAMGFLSTIANVYGVQNGQWSLTAKITISIISLCLACSSSAYLLYAHVLLPKLRT